MRRACLVTTFVRSSSSPTHSHRSNETNHIHHIWRTWWLMRTHMSSANFMLNFVHLSAIKVFVRLVFSLEMWFLFSKQWKTCVSLHVVNKPRHPLSEPSGWKGLGGQRAMTWACSLLSKTQKKPCYHSLDSCHWRKEKSDSHQDLWNLPTAFKCVFFFQRSKDSRLLPRKIKKMFDNLRWNNCLNLVL